MRNAAALQSNSRYADDFILQKNVINENYLSAIDADSDSNESNLPQQSIAYLASNEESPSFVFGSSILATDSAQTVIQTIGLPQKVFDTTLSGIIAGEVAVPSAITVGSVSTELVPYFGRALPTSMTTFGSPITSIKSVESIPSISDVWSLYGTLEPKLGMNGIVLEYLTGSSNELGLLTLGDLYNGWTILGGISWGGNPSTNESSSYYESLLQVLEQFKDYDGEGWDGYDAQPITVDVLDAAKSLIALFPNAVTKPNVAPGADGTIGFEWRFNRGPLRKLYIDVGYRGKIFTYSEPVRGHPKNHVWNSVNDLTRKKIAELFGTN